MAAATARSVGWYPWYVVFVLTATYTFSFIDRQIISLLVGPIQSDLGITDFEISLLQGLAFGLFYTFLGIPIGRMADRKSRRMIITVGISIWSLLTVACGLARNYWQLFLARLGVGVGEATLSPSAYSMISDYFPRNRLATAISIYFAGVYLGSGIAFILGGWVIDLVSGQSAVSLPLIGEVRAWQAAFILVGVPGAFFVLWLQTVREPPRRDRIYAGAEVPHAGWGDVWKFVRPRARAYILISLAFGIHGLLGYGQAAWVPEFYVRVHGMARADIAYYFGLITLVFGTAGLIFGGWVSDRMEAKGRKDAKLMTAAAGTTLLIPFVVAYPIVESTELSLLLLAFNALFAGIPYGVGAASLQVITPNEMRALVSAAFLFILNIVGLTFGSSSIAALTDFVFADPMAVGKSISITAAWSAPMVVLLLLLARRPFVRHADEAIAWSDH